MNSKSLAPLLIPMEMNGEITRPVPSSGIGPELLSSFQVHFTPHSNTDTY
jgi:hypothetical protein